MRTISFLFFLLILVGGCSGSSSQSESSRLADQSGGSPSQPALTQSADQPGLKRFESAAELAAFLTGINTSAGTVRSPTVVTVGDVATGASGPIAAADEGFSTTTIQEIGVDESDLVKNDGTHLYILKRSEVRIVRAQPAEMIQQVSSVRIDGFGTGLYLRGNMLIALSQITSFVPTPDPVIPTPAVIVDPAPGSFSQKTIVRVIDISNRSAPQVSRTITLDGRLINSRLIDRKLHLILSESLPTLTGVISVTQLSNILPVFTTTMPGGLTQSDLIVRPTAFYRPVEISIDGNSVPIVPLRNIFTTVVTIDLDDPGAFMESLSMFSRSSETLYVSRETLYLAEPVNYACLEFRCFLAQTGSTELHKITLTERGPIYVASGVIPGRPLDQFSFSEHNGFLWVATTTTPGPSNNVFALRDSANRLDIVGRIENIARGEMIRSARFVGDLGFLVTFRQIDPLFTLDLSDPTRPRLVGELKVPGFSTFILPMSRTELLTVGRDADLAGRPLGLQLSIFDVSNFANPTLKHNVVISGRDTISEALSNPKAFTYFAERQVLALPIREFQSNRSSSGLIVYRASGQAGFELLGRINIDPGTYTRGVFISNNVYAITPDLVRAAPLSNVNSAPWSVLLQ